MFDVVDVIDVLDVVEVPVVFVPVSVVLEPTEDVDAPLLVLDEVPPSSPELLVL